MPALVSYGSQSVRSAGGFFRSSSQTQRVKIVNSRLGHSRHSLPLLLTLALVLVPIGWRPALLKTEIVNVAEQALDYHCQMGVL